MRLLDSQPGHEVWTGDSLHGLPREVDAIVTDPPYSERCHSGHDRKASHDNSFRRSMSYSSWSEDDARRACRVWHPLCKGWIVIINDHLLARVFEEELAALGRYVFAPVPFVSPGISVRLAGDGPSSWTRWCVVARPRTPQFAKWGALPGAYIFKPERSLEVIGGKPLALMKALVSDYSRPGDLVCDPCCGAGTTGRAAMDCGRRSLQIDSNPDHAAMAAKRLRQQVLAI